MDVYFLLFCPFEEEKGSKIFGVRYSVRDIMEYKRELEKMSLFEHGSFIALRGESIQDSPDCE